MKRFYLLLLIALGIFSGCNYETDLQPQETSDNSLETRSLELVYKTNSVVPIDLVKEIAKKYTPLQEKQFLRDKNSYRKREVQDYHILKDKNGIPSLYVVTYKNKMGYLVISADWKHEPICAVTTSGTYPDMEAPSMLIEWFAATIENIELIRSGEINNSARGIMKWNRLIEELDISARVIPIDSDCCEECPNWPDCQYDPVGCGDATVYCGDPCGNSITTIKGPLMSTQWGQRRRYNDNAPFIVVLSNGIAIPFDVCPPGESCCQASTGCVATAISQIMNFHQFPNNYNWGNMPDLSGTTETARLMRDVGDAVDMNWGCRSSSADTDDVPGALKNDFNYSTADKDSYDSGSYLTVVNNINNNKPVYLDGCRSKKTFLGITYKYTDCHAWVCDGYWRTRNNCYSYLKLYMNWGWYGDHNGWFAFNNWHISGNNRNYQYANEYIHNIQP